MSNKAGVKKVKGAEAVGLVPRLRFPEFRGAGEWSYQNLGNVAQFFKGRGISKSDIDARGEIPCIRYGELYTTYGEVIDAVVSKTTLPLASLFLSHKYDVLMPSSGETRIDIARAACVLMSGVGLGGDLNVLRSKENGVFLSYFLNGACKKTIAKRAQGDTIVHLYPSHITSLLIPIPDGREQQKIANCLSSLDEVITLESQKLEALKVHKKGLMQQLFPAEGETVPRLRFPEFRGAGEWEAQSICKACEYYSGGTPATANKRFYGGRIPFIRSAEIDAYKTELSLTDEGLSNSSAKMVKEGDILIALYGANSGDVALSKINGAINQAILCLRHTTSNAFVFHYLLHKKTWIISTYLQGGQGNLSGEIVKSITLYYPSAGEQQKIADCLSSLDDRISLEAQRLDVLKTHKKGLMQQLFPKLEEV